MKRQGTNVDLLYITYRKGQMMDVQDIRQWGQRNNHRIKKRGLWREWDVLPYIIYWLLLGDFLSFNAGHSGASFGQWCEGMLLLFGIVMCGYAYLRSHRTESERRERLFGKKAELRRQRKINEAQREVNRIREAQPDMEMHPSE